jgi:endonuclease YncB( thermonuclease family)
MRAALLLLVLVVVATGCDDAEAPSAADREPATVEWVVDGDTVRLDDGRQVRLVQIDAPEAGSDCFGRDATRALIALTPRGTRVALERDPRLDAADGYGRLLRYVFVGGTNVNVELVRRGAASPYAFRNERGRYAGVLDDAVADAMSEERGLWAACPLARLEPGLGSVTGPASSQRG